MRQACIALVVALGLVAVDASLADAQSGRDFGLGIIIGDPTGVSGKHLLSDAHAIDWAVGFGLIGGDHLRVHADFLWQFRIETWDSAALDLHVGAGPKLGIKGKNNNDNFRLGARGPFGVSLVFLKVPIDVFVEVAAGLWIIEKVDLHVDGAIGARYWF